MNFYVWALLTGFSVMTILFIFAEAEVKSLKRKMAAKEEDNRFDEVYRQIEREAQAMGERLVSYQRNLSQEINEVQNEIQDVWIKIGHIQQEPKTSQRLAKRNKESRSRKSGFFIWQLA